jgi:hypothetical protein
MNILVYDDRPQRPDPQLIACTCGSIEIRVRTSRPGQEARISYLICETCSREWKVRGTLRRSLYLDP